MHKIHTTVHIVGQFYFSSYFDTKRKAPIYEYSYTSAFVFVKVCVSVFLLNYIMCVLYFIHISG